MRLFFLNPSFCIHSCLPTNPSFGFCSGQKLYLSVSRKKCTFPQLQLLLVSEQVSVFPLLSFQSAFYYFTMETSAFPLPNLPTFFSAFVVIYITGYFVVFRNWSPKHRPEAASCFISYAHGTAAAVMAALSIVAQTERGFASQNTDFQNMVLDFSIAYFLLDLLHYLVFVPSDVLFIGHHLATLFVFVTCRYLVIHGAFAILVLLVLAEITSFCQNTWTLASAWKADLPIAARLYEFLSPPFYAFYTVVRGFVGPFFVYKMAVFYLSGEADRVIPRWLWVSWMIVVVTAISVSILWIWNLWLVLYKERYVKLERKTR